jgi:UDP-N-acetylmuramoyl-tripeptide--D-alanyl-D-alanine ligase
MDTAALYELFIKHSSISTDTRKIEPGSLFFALKGPNFNANTFAAEALEKGAAYCIIDEKEHAVNDRCVLVDDVLSALQQLARHHRRQFDIPVIAVVGSNGKTTTKELITSVLATTYKV